MTVFFVIKTSLFTEGRYVFRPKSTSGESEYVKGDCECLFFERDFLYTYFLLLVKAYKIINVALNYVNCWCLLLT
jgi:hypothetical protein